MSGPAAESAGPTASAKYGLDASLDQDSASLRASAFSELVRQRSGGVIRNLRAISLEEPSEKTPARFSYSRLENVRARLDAAGHR